ncbi:cobalamin biosynthesis protein CobG [Streptomyces platensis]|uniref:Cobalamin biosynthesis protein CobG n=2 Tax=Streptomyces platensis TaxID=58346 RepID=A0AAE6NJL9_STRPT|nr:cobalamin biosynthesis protein CobG [Streptomyces platensis]
MLAAMPPSPSTRPHGSEPPIRDRGDACPGALRLHSAADGHLARVRLPAGDLTARQAEALAGAADRLGDGHLSLTSRGNAELRGLPDDCGSRLAALLRDAGLLPSERHERLRNILASPLAGLDRHTPPDVRLWARELDRLLCTSESATALSGRFLFVLDDGRGDVAALGGDVSLVAEPTGTGAPADHGDRSGPGHPARPGGSALLRVGDDPAALRIAGPDAPRAALTAAEAFLSTAEASGTGAWRVRELPAGHALTARGVAERLRGAGVGFEFVAGATDVVVAADVADAAQVAGAEARASDEPVAPGSPPYSASALATSALAAASAPYATTTPYPTPVPYADSSAPGIIEGRDGVRALSVLAPLGRLSVAQWRLLAAVAEADGDGVLRLTPWRGIVVPGLSAEVAAARLRELAGAGLITDPDSPWHRIGACTGRPGCAKSRTDVRADATAAVTAGTSVPVSMSVSGTDTDTGPGFGAGTDPVRLPGEPRPGPKPGPNPGPEPEPGPGPGPGPRPASGPGPGPDNPTPRHHLPVYWSGCERRCGHPHGAWVDVLATADGYRVSVVRPKNPPAPAAPPTAPGPTS